MGRMYDLSFEQLNDGTIRLAQADSSSDDLIIDLHPQQIRFVAESFGLVEAHHPDNELSKQLAEQLCRVYLEMHDEYRHLSHELEGTYLRLSGFIDAIPNSVFPFHLWDERDEKKKKAEAEKEARKAAQKLATSATDVSKNKRGGAPEQINLLEEAPSLAGMEA